MSVKNILGATIGGHKGRFHSKGIHQGIVDINLYKTPDLAIIDGIEGKVRGELGGRNPEIQYNDILPRPRGGRIGWSKYTRC